ncbi:MAG: hypothetical protein AB1657_06050 [Candidatus Micrarchaeota archaeon]
MNGIRFRQETPGNREPHKPMGRNEFARARAFAAEGCPRLERRLNKRAKELLKALKRVDKLVRKGELPEDFEVPLNGTVVLPYAMYKEIDERARIAVRSGRSLLGDIVTGISVIPFVMLLDRIESLGFPTGLVVGLSSMTAYVPLVAFIRLYAEKRCALLHEARYQIFRDAKLIELPAAIDEAIEAGKQAGT